MLPATGGNGGDQGLQGPSPLLTPDQLQRVRLAAARSPYYTDDSNSLRCLVISAVPVTVTFAARQGDLEGAIFPNNFPVKHPGDRSVVIQDFPLGEGLLFNVLAIVTTGAPLVGQTYVAVSLVIGQGNTATNLATFIGHTITTTQPAGWPGSPIESSTSGEPVVRVIRGTTPALGADFVEVVPTGARWELLTLTANFTPNPIGFRNVNFFLFNGAVVIAFMGGNNDNLPAGSSSYHFWPGLTVFDQVLGVQHYYSMPYNLILLAGTQIQSNTNGMLAGDQWSAPVYTVREWQEGI